MFTNDKILYFLKYLNKNDGSKGDHLCTVIRTHLSLGADTAYATFINHIEQKGYIRHDSSSKYFVTQKGKIFIFRKSTLHFSKIAITYFIVPIVVMLTFIFQFIWKPDFLSFDKKDEAPENKIIEFNSDTLSQTMVELDSLSQIDSVFSNSPIDSTQ